MIGGSQAGMYYGEAPADPLTSTSSWRRFAPIQLPELLRVSFRQPEFYVSAEETALSARSRTSGQVQHPFTPAPA